VPQKGAGNEGTKFSASHWDRFTASLFMVLRLDAGQANYFDLAEAASREHPSYVLAADAALRAGRRPKTAETAAAASNAAEKPATKEASVDAINQQLQRIEDLRRKFEREDALILELAPAVNLAADDKVAESKPEAPVAKSKRRYALISGLAAGVTAVAGGLWWLFHGA